MRFMIIRKADANTEAGRIPPGVDAQKLFQAMDNYNQEMAKAGVFISGDGLKPSSNGARVTLRQGKPIVTDGPFAETKELIAGYTVIRASSLAEAVEWVKKWPKEDGEVTLEIRPFYEEEDIAALLANTST